MAEETWVAGVDGTRRGWVVALLTVGLTRLDLRPVGEIREVLDFPEAPAVVAVDMPIGLHEAARRGGLECDRAARRRLGRRASSVFSPPARPALSARSWEEASRLNRASSGDAVGLSMQAFALFGKLRELDGFVTPRLQARFREVHPEVSFREMAGEPCRHRKKRVAGREERLDRIGAQGVPDPSPWLTLAARRDLGAQADDVLDAVAAAWSARRIWSGTGVRMPERPALDGRGLAMEIVA